MFCVKSANPTPPPPRGDPQCKHQESGSNVIPLPPKILSLFIHIEFFFFSKKCVVPENIHTTPWEVSFLGGGGSDEVWTPHHSGHPLGMPLGLGNDALIWGYFVIILFSWFSPKTFDINTTQLAEEYKKLQWKLHPDKFSELSKVLHAMQTIWRLFSKFWNPKLSSFSGQ